MPSVTINLDDDVQKVISKRAKKNMLTLREQVEDIVRQSAVRTKAGSVSDDKIDDTLVGVFSRSKRGRRAK